MILLPYILAVYSGAHVNHTPCPARISSRQEIAEAPPASWLAHKADMNHVFDGFGLYFGHPERPVGPRSIGIFVDMEKTYG